MKLKVLILLIFALTIFSGCEYDKNLAHKDVYNEKMISINQYFNETIQNYNHTIINITSVCLSGDCSEYKDNTQYPVSQIKQCYFCNSEILGKDMLHLYSSKYSSGSSDVSFGCLKKFTGDDIEGLRIIEKTNDKIVFRGFLTHEFLQKSIICDRNSDPECDDQVYGKCSGLDYSIEFKKEVEFTVERNN